MKFLKAKKVEQIIFWDDRKISTKLTTKDWSAQCFEINMEKKYGPEKTEILIQFDKNHPAPKALNISANQYTLSPAILVIKCYKKGAREPYLIKELDEISTKLEFENDTTRIVIACDKRAKYITRLSVNYIKYNEI